MEGYAVNEVLTTCYNMDEPRRLVLSEMSHSQKDKYCTIPCIRCTLNSQLYRDKDGHSEYQGLERGRSGELLLNEYGVSVMEDENVLEIDGDSCTKVGLYLTPLNYTIKMVNFVIYILL